MTGQLEPDRNVTANAAYSPLITFFWHLFVAGALVVVPSQLRSGPVWTINPDLRPFLVGACAAYLAAGIASLAIIRARRRISPSLVLSAVLPLTALAFWLLTTGRAVSGFLLLCVVAITPVAIAIPVLIRPRWLTAATVFVAITTVACVAVGVRGLSAAAAARAEQLARKTRSFVPAKKGFLSQPNYEVRTTYYRNVFGPIAALGGGIDRLGEGYIVALPDGRLRAMQTSGIGGDVTVTVVDRTVPMARQEFLADVRADTVHRADTNWFRTGDVLTQEDGERVRIFVSHHYWDAAERCFSVRVSVSDNAIADVAAGTLQEWTTLYTSRPCLRIKPTGHPFAGNQMGGRMALLNERSLLLTVGDHEFDGVGAPELISQDPEADYGKTILIDLPTGRSRVYSSGHRNPQGLWVTTTGEIWLTEHGPRGGDELNLIVDGANYGWPLVTYGAAYLSDGYVGRDWPLNAAQARHDGYTRPARAWLPSIGISSVLQLSDSLFTRWRGDLLVASLNAHTLYRLHREEGRFIFDEAIDVGERVRDMVQALNGDLILLTEPDSGDPGSMNIVVMNPVLEHDTTGTGLMRGALVFGTCAGCHPMDASGQSGIGPNLRGVVGAPVARRGAYRYSGALRALGGRWTEARLDSFLANPRRFAPGTSMGLDSVTRAADRAAVIEYLKSLR